MSEKRYYRADELADMLSVNVQTVRRWLRQGRIVCVRIMGIQRIPVSEIDRIVNAVQRDVTQCSPITVNRRQPY